MQCNITGTVASTPAITRAYNTGNFNEAFNNYQRALEIDPRHRSAHEYVGEAYLLTNNLPKAEEHLAALKQICGVVCEQYKDLARDIAEYRKKH